MNNVAKITPEYRVARKLTDKIRVGLINAAETAMDIHTAFTSGAWLQLGYESWQEYCEREFESHTAHLPTDIRRAIVGSLTELGGLSQRQISAATGVSQNTIFQDQQVIGNLSDDDQEMIEDPLDPDEIVDADDDVEIVSEVEWERDGRLIDSVSKAFYSFARSRLRLDVESIARAAVFDPDFGTQLHDDIVRARQWFKKIETITRAIERR
jgi:hypothetical protein